MFTYVGKECLEDARRFGICFLGNNRIKDIVFLLGYPSDFGGPKMPFLNSFESLTDYRW